MNARLWTYAVRAHSSSQLNSSQDIMNKTDEYPETLHSTTTTIRESLPDIPPLPAMDKLLTTQDGTITVMARQLESLAAHYDQMAGALHESEAGEEFSEEDLLGMFSMCRCLTTDSRSHG
jgi:autophagy-related protein 17